MPKKATIKSAANTLPLAKELEGQVDAWAKQGWAGVTKTTRELMAHWFERDEDDADRFHPCQRRAIETIIYCHEALGIKSLKHAYLELAPNALKESAPIAQEAEKIPFAKYALKMATGSGKTWALAALLVWQYFNAINNPDDKRFCNRFMLVAPGHEVLHRLLAMFLGKPDIASGMRDKSRSDFAKELFVPSGARWRDRFHWEILQPADLRANTSPPDGAFVFITNWQQFRLKSTTNVWDQLTGADAEERPRGEVIADFLAEAPGLIVLNDEAHHVHDAKKKNDEELEELVWRRFMRLLRDRIVEKHKKKAGVFLQIDFSATPFYGNGPKKEYFSHIVYDYNLIAAMQDMLVKQIFLEERQAIGGEETTALNMLAEREDPDEDHTRGKITKLAPGQLTMLEIGRRKLEQIAGEFKKRGIDKKPVLFVLTENTEVADMVAEHFGTLDDERGRNYGGQTLVVHSGKKGDLGEKGWEKYRLRLETLDEPEEANPYRVVVSVLMLREGFDTRNVAVIVVLRSAKADLLLEQVVGRGLRLMFPPAGGDAELQELKREARQALEQRRMPENSLDFLFVVEHPRFREFYEELRRQGYAIGSGDISEVPVTDLSPVEAMQKRNENYDLVWPLQVFEESQAPDISGVDVGSLPVYNASFELLQKQMAQLSITDRHTETGSRAKTWKLENDYYDYTYFLERAARAVARSKNRNAFTGQMADIAAIIDRYARRRLFGRDMDFSKPKNYSVLNYPHLFDFVTDNVRSAIAETVGDTPYETRASALGRASEIPKFYAREENSIPTTKCIYPRIGFRKSGDGFEKAFIANVLEESGEVEAYVKLLERKHSLNIAYRDGNGIVRSYYPDFVVKTAEKMYLVETKAETEITKAEADAKNPITIKARAGKAWCATASRVPIDGQPTEWEYLVVSSRQVLDNPGGSFVALVEEARILTERLVTASKGRLI